MCLIRRLSHKVRFINHKMMSTLYVVIDSRNRDLASKVRWLSFKLPQRRLVSKWGLPMISWIRIVSLFERWFFEDYYLAGIRASEGLHFGWGWESGMCRLILLPRLHRSRIRTFRHNIRKSIRIIIINVIFAYVYVLLLMN